MFNIISSYKNKNRTQLNDESIREIIKMCFDNCEDNKEFAIKNNIDYKSFLNNLVKLKRILKDKKEMLNCQLGVF
jgi:flagellin-specific chaperone FliS